MDRFGHSTQHAALRYQHVARSRPDQIANAIERLLDAAAPAGPTGSYCEGDDGQLGLEL